MLGFGALGERALGEGPMPTPSGWLTLLDTRRPQSPSLAAQMATTFVAWAPFTVPWGWFVEMSIPLRAKPSLAALQQFEARPAQLRPNPNLTAVMFSTDPGDSFLGTAASFNVPASAEIGVVDTSAPGTEIGVIVTTSSTGNVASVSISVRIV